MHIENFEIGLKKAENWFKKNLTTDQMETYYTHLSFIPDVAIVDIFNDIIKETKPNPSQFPTINDLFKGWYKWQQDHPHMIEKRKKVNCSECAGAGLLWFRPPVEDGAYPYEYIIGCEFCKNWKVDIGTKRKIPLSTRSKLESRGYAVFPYDYSSMKNKKYKSLKEMTDSIGEEV
jgi:hypothetical protein